MTSEKRTATGWAIPVFFVKKARQDEHDGFIHRDSSFSIVFEWQADFIMKSSWN